MEEEKWFQAPTWNLESGTESVLIFLSTNGIGFLHLAKTIQLRTDVVLKYLESLGFKCLEKTSLATTIQVNLVEKTIFCIGLRLIDPNEHIAVPSQIPTYLEANKGFLTGRKFGL